MDKVVDECVRLRERVAELERECADLRARLKEHEAKTVKVRWG